MPAAAAAREALKTQIDQVEQELRRTYFAVGKYGVKIESTITPLERNRVGIAFDISEGAVATIKQINGNWDARTLHRNYQAFQHMVLDCPPSLESHASIQALRACDVALIPVLPSPVDLWASMKLPEEIEEARKVNPNIQAFLVLNQLEPRSALSSAMRDALIEFGMPVLDAGLRRRAAYRNAALEGLSVYQMGGRGTKAVEEMEAIIEEVIGT